MITHGLAWLKTGAINRPNFKPANNPAALEYRFMTNNPFHRAHASRLGMIAGMALTLTGAAMPAISQNVPWVVETMPSRTPVETCKAVINQTARGAVQRCLGKVGVVIPFEDFIATATPVCKTTHV